MARRVYWKGLRLVLGASERYIQRWDLQLQENLTEAQYTCVLAVLTAILECLELLPDNPPTE